MDIKKLNRLNEIEEEAINFYLEKTDFDVSEWIQDEDKKEWRELKKEITGECPTCGACITTSENVLPEICDCTITDKLEENNQK